MGPGGAEGPRTTHASAARLGHGHGHGRHAAEGEMPLPGAFCWAQYVLKTFKPQDFSDGLPSGRGVLPTREGGAASLLLAAPPKPRRPPQVRPAVSRDRAWGLGALSESGPAGPRRGGAERSGGAGARWAAVAGVGWEAWPQRQSWRRPSSRKVTGTGRSGGSAVPALACAPPAAGQGGAGTGLGLGSARPGSP